MTAPLRPDILGPDGRPLRVALPARSARAAQVAIRGRYDVARTVTDNARHWVNADGLSARAANDRETRYRLRTRSRYECTQNNSYAWGIVQTLANHTIGTGPRLQLLTPDRANNAAIEAAFCAWCCAVGLPEKLRTMRQARAVDGEAFALFGTNPRVRGPVKLDLTVIEADQIATPTLNPLDPRYVDGIEYDDYGNPSYYHLLPYHPGDLLAFGQPFGSFDRIPADLVLHWFRPIRPGQCRGVPDLTPALKLFAELRRYSDAVRRAAETAADFAGVLESDAPADPEDAIQGEPFETLEVDKGMLTTLPAGTRLHQMQAEQPTAQHDAFVRSILREIGRCLNMPLNVVSGDSSGYNYSSGRLDHQTYFQMLCVDQAQLGMLILDRIFDAWLAEAKLATRLIPGPPDPDRWPRCWLWQGMEHVDPEKEANAQEILLRNGMTTFSDECRRQGVDPETRVQTMARDRAMFAAAGIPIPPSWSGETAAPSPAADPNAPDPNAPDPAGDPADAYPQD